MDGGSSSAPLERSYSQQSATSTKSHRSTVRGSRRRLISQTSSSASSIAASDKSLVSFPSFSPGSPKEDRQLPPDASDGAAVLSRKPGSPPTTCAPSATTTTISTTTTTATATTNKTNTAGTEITSTPAPATSSIVDSLTAISPLPLASASSTRSALFEDSPLNAKKIPGALHLADDEHIERLIARHGAVPLVRQIAEDLAQRDAQISALRTRAGDRERALRRIILECGLSNLDLETRLRAVEREARKPGGGDGSSYSSRQVSDLVNDAMANSVSTAGAAGDFYGQATVRASSGSSAPPASDPADSANSKGTIRLLKDYIWGQGTSRKSSRSSSINGDAVAGKQQQQSQQTVIRAPLPGDRRPTLQDDLFSPPDAAESIRSSSRASSINNGVSGGSRKPSTPFATLVRMVAGGGSVGSKDAGPRGRANSGATGGSMRTPSVSSQRTNGSARVVSSAQAGGGPKALMSMRRPTGAPNLATSGNSRTTPEERWDTMITSPIMESVSRQESYGPVEMDKILPPEGQPPTLAHTYNNKYNGSEELTDRFGFIYDQRRKKRQKASQLAGQGNKPGSGRAIAAPSTEMLTNGKPSISPTVTEDSSSAKWDVGSEGRPGSPSSTEEIREEGGRSTKKWYDYLKVVTFGTEPTTELLSDTPAMSTPGIEVTEGHEAPPKSPGMITSEDRGFIPSASTTTSAIDTRDPIAAATTAPQCADEQSVQQQQQQHQQAPVVTAGAGTFVKDNDAEPVKQLLEQLNSLHDALQKKRMDRWNEFQRKVRAERRRNDGAAEAAAAAAAGGASGSDARFHRMPETRLADGELIGIADLGNKGKVGRAKWGEFRQLVLGGVPVVLRAKVWAECSGAIDLRIPGYYDDLVARRRRRRHGDGTSGGGGEGETGAGEGEGEDEGEGDNPDVVTQIRADINRTLTDNIFFRKGLGVEKLHDVLLAYSRRNPEVGYCQGMNLIAANLLLLTPSAEDAFWLLAAVVEQILPANYYDHSLLASRADQVVLRSYVSELLPRLSSHFESLSIDLETMTFQWFLSVFTDCLSAEALFRVWDVVLCLAPDGSTFLFQVALALLKLNEAQLLQCATPAAVYTYINHQMTNHAISIDGLIQASEGLRRFVRREDAAARRARAVAAERELARLREEERRRSAAASASAGAWRGRKARAAEAVVVVGGGGDVVDAAGGSAKGQSPAAVRSPLVDDEGPAAAVEGGSERV